MRRQEDRKISRRRGAVETETSAYQGVGRDLGDASPAQGGDGEFSALTHVHCGEILRDRDTALDLRGVEVGRVGEEFVVRLFGARL